MGASDQSSQQHPTNQVNSILQHPTNQVNSTRPIKSTASYQSSQQHPTNQVNSTQPIKSTAPYQSSQQRLTNQVNSILPIKSTTSYQSSQQHPTNQADSKSANQADPDNSREVNSSQVYSRRGLCSYWGIGATLLDTLFENDCGVKGKSRI